MGEAVRKQRGEALFLLVLCHSLSAFKKEKASGRLPLDVGVQILNSPTNRILTWRLVLLQGETGFFFFILFWKTGHKKTCVIFKLCIGFLKNTDVRAKGELRQTKAVEMYRIFSEAQSTGQLSCFSQPLLRTSRSLPPPLPQIKPQTDHCQPVKKSYLYAPQVV